MDDWEPEVYDSRVDDVSDETREYFKRRSPESITPMGMDELMSRLDPESGIEYHRTLSDRITSLKDRCDVDALAQSRLEHQHSSLAAEFAYAIPTVEALDYLVDHSPLVELFAGNGYWAYEIEQHGGTVHAYDANPPHDAWTDVESGTQDALLHHAENDPRPLSLLLCWPPVGPAAYDALHIARPDHVFFVGEMPADGFKMMANHEFFQHLDARYTKETTINLPSIQPAMDDLHHFTTGE